MCYFLSYHTLHLTHGFQLLTITVKLSAPYFDLCLIFL